MPVRAEVPSAADIAKAVGPRIADPSDPTAEPDPATAGRLHSAADSAGRSSGDVPSSGATADRSEGARAASTCPECGADLEHGDIFCGECGAVVAAAIAGRALPQDTAVIGPRATRDAESGSTPSSQPATRPSRPSSSVDRDADVEATRLVPPRAAGQRFVLQFSTGESVTVTGSGLIGRNPTPEPGEFVEQLVRVLDSTRSVSKTHLEFGQESGAFWVRDRYSGNGTVLREPDAPPRRCDPGKRYRVMRGSRLEIGEQFMIVS